MEIQTHSEFFPFFQDAKDSGNNDSLASMCDSLQQEFLEILRIYYGYIPPSPYPTYMPPIADESEAKLVLKSFGESPTRTLMFYKHRPVLQLAHQFLEQLIKRGVPPPITCDFNDESPAARSLATSHRLHHLRKVFTGPSDKQVWYMFDFGTSALTNWHLAVQNPRDALVICRLPNTLSEFEIAQYLVQHGIPFHTLQSEKTIPRDKERPLPPSSCVLPTRPRDYVFRKKDYDAYLLQRNAIFARPSGRAALMRGGFVWRLAVLGISIISVFDGPSGWNELAADSDTMFSAKDITTGEVFLDDQLTNTELDLICGAYICDMAINNQVAIKSWYPLPSTFDKCGENYGRWTSHSEEGFQRRTNEIHDGGEGGRGPLNASKWRDLMTGMRDVRYVNENLERWCAEFLERCMAS